MPATNVSAPARAHSAAVWKLMPPSTLDAVGQFPLAPPGLGLLDFWQRLVDEFLSAKSGIDRHHQQQINLIQMGLNLGNGRGRIDGQADFFPELLDFPDQRRDLFAKFDVNNDFVRAGLGERFEQDLRPGAHEVNVKKHFGQRPDGPHDCRARRKCWAQNGRP